MDDKAKKWLGLTATDEITGFKGVATGYVQYLSGCNQVLLVPRSHNNEFKDGVWFDEQRLVVDATIKRVELDNGRSPGPDKAAPKR